MYRQQPKVQATKHVYRTCDTRGQKSTSKTSPIKILENFEILNDVSVKTQKINSTGGLEGTGLREWKDKLDLAPDEL